MVRILISLAVTGLVAGVALVGLRPAQAADSHSGAQIFKAQCSVCHGNKSNSPPGVGPRLFGVVGRNAGTLKGFSYSKAMKQADIVWSSDKLKQFIGNPAKTVPGNQMPFAGLHDTNKLESLVSYLETLR